MTKQERILGWEEQVVVGSGYKAARKNGPHHDAKWAKDMLGTNLTSSQRKARVVKGTP